MATKPKPQAATSGLTKMAAGAAIWEWPRPARWSAAAGSKRYAVAYVAELNPKSETL